MNNLDRIEKILNRGPEVMKDLPIERLERIIKRKTSRLTNITNNATEEIILTNANMVLIDIKEKQGLDEFSVECNLVEDKFKVSIDLTIADKNHTFDFEI